MKIPFKFPKDNHSLITYSITGEYLQCEDLRWLTITGPERMRDVLFTHSDNFTTKEVDFILDLLNTKDISNYKIAFHVINSKPDVKKEKRNTKVNQTRKT